GGGIGYEELDLTWEAFEGFGLGGLGAQPASLILRRWRELRSWEDLAYYVIGAQMTLAAITAALDLVEKAQSEDRAVTELEAYERYRAMVASELERLSLPVRVRTYFTHAYGGNRSLIPARPTAHPLSPLTSLKIDAGLEVYDPSGVLRAVSDITRSVVGTSEAEDAYRLFDEALTEGAIAACRAGRTGEEVFASGIGWLEPCREVLVGHGLLPPKPEPLSSLFGRDIGHLLGKQEPATVVFEKGNAEALEPGMVAAAEIQWPYRDYCIGVEDVFMITEGPPLNLTRPEDDS
ncbi:MAG: M24 family metallopeptidase, partial [Acidimicrobiales bacterium]